MKRITFIDHFVSLIPASSRQGQENSKLRRRGKCFRFCDLFVRTFSVLPHLSTHSIYYKRALQSTTAHLFCIQYHGAAASLAKWGVAAVLQSSFSI